VTALSFAIDVNILLYASDTASPYRKKAADFLSNCLAQRELFYLGWPTVVGYLLIATHPSIFANALTPEEAKVNIETLANSDHVRILSEKEGFWAIYKEVTSEVPTRGNWVPDAHLAALLKQHGVKKLFTHDRDFLKFPFLEIRDPLA
jgi:hypothetical protein